jgi:hypothetical protein
MRHHLTDSTQTNPLRRKSVSWLLLSLAVIMLLFGVAAARAAARAHGRGAPIVHMTVQGGNGFADCANNSDGSGTYYYLPTEVNATDPHGLPLRYRWTDSADGGRAHLARVSPDASPHDAQPTLRMFFLRKDLGHRGYTTHVLSLTVSNGKRSTKVSVSGRIYPLSFCLTR